VPLLDQEIKKNQVPVESFVNRKQSHTTAKTLKCTRSVAAPEGVPKTGLSISEYYVTIWKILNGFGGIKLEFELQIGS